MCLNLMFPLGVRPRNQGLWFTTFTIHEVGKYLGFPVLFFEEKKVEYHLQNGLLYKIYKLCVPKGEIL